MSSINYSSQILDYLRENEKYMVINFKCIDIKISAYNKIAVVRIKRLHPNI